VIPRTDALTAPGRRTVAALVLAAAAVLPLAGCDVVDSLTGASSSTTTTSAPDLEPTPAATGTAGAPAPQLTLPPVPGYAYTDPPKQVSDQLAGVGKQYGGVFTGTAAKGVTRGGKPVAAVLQYSVDSGVTGTKEFDDKLLDGMLSGLAGQGAVTKREVIGAQPVVTANPKQGTGIVAWFKDDVITMVLGADPSEARQLATLYLKQA
jgi:hypothetical protein